VTKSTVNGTLVTTFEDFDGAFPRKVTSPDNLVSQVVYAPDHWMLPKDVTTKGPSGGVTTNYQYDALHRLELLTVNGVGTAIEYLGNTRLPSVMKRGGIPIVRYNYDASQRLLSIKDLYGVNVVGSDTSNITYDALNRPASVSNGDGSSQIFTYGELGNIEKTVTNFGSVMGFDFNKMEIK
jgi:YD repeat-containing protein